MFSRLYTLVALSLAVGGGVLATPVMDFATSGSLTRRQNDEHRGVATFFFQNGNAGACGLVHPDTDQIVALQTTLFANGAHCGQTITITDTDTGVTATGVVADECPSCGAEDNIDLSTGLFDQFAPESQGVVNVAWVFA